MDGAIRCGSRYFKCGDGLYGTGRGLGASCQSGDHERLFPQYFAGPGVYFALGSGYGGRGSGSCYFFVLLWKKRGRTFVCIHPRKFSLEKRIVWGICNVGIPASIQNLLNVTGMTILNNFTSSFGADAVAAMGITQKINMVPMNVAMGLSQGIMPLISYNYSSRNHKRMKGTLVFAVKASLGFIAIVAVGYFVGAAQLTQLFMDNETIVAYGTKFLRGFCLGLPFLCMDFIAVGVFQAVGMGREALLFAIMRKIVLEIPALYILNFLFPLYGLAYAQLTAEVVLAVAAVLVLARLFKRISKENTIS